MTSRCLNVKLRHGISMTTPSPVWLLDACCLDRTFLDSEYVIASTLELGARNKIPPPPRVRVRGLIVGHWGGPPDAAGSRSVCTSCWTNWKRQISRADSREVAVSAAICQKCRLTGTDRSCVLFSLFSHHAGAPHSLSSRFCHHRS